MKLQNNINPILQTIQLHKNDPVSILVLNPLPMKTSFRSLLFVLFFAVTKDLFALPIERNFFWSKFNRIGIFADNYYRGGSGENDWVWIGFMIFTLTLLAIALFFLIRFCVTTFWIRKKTVQSEQILEQICNSDNFWNQEQMESYASDIYHQLQTAWAKRDLEKVKHALAPELTEYLQTKLDEMKNRKEINMLDHIFIDRVNIIACEDFRDNKLDRYTAFITGTVMDYTLCEETERILKNKNKEIDEFNETYHFIRKDNLWLLESIISQAGTKDLLQAKSFVEK